MSQKRIFKRKILISKHAILIKDGIELFLAIKKKTYLTLMKEFMCEKKLPKDIIKNFKLTIRHLGGSIII